MSINLSSRYSTGHFTRDYIDPRKFSTLRTQGFTGPQTAATPIIKRNFERPRTDSVYYWVEGDRWDMVAARAGIPKADWWKILDANPEIEFPLSMQPGDPVRLPVVSEYRR